jgi:hypothetical protein
VQLEDFAQHLFQNSEKQAAFVLEVIEQQTMRDACCLGDITDVDVVVGLTREQVGRDTNERRSALPAS